MTINNQLRILRRSEILQLTGISKSTLYNRINEGLFPTPISIAGSRAVGYNSVEVEKVIQAICAEQTPEQIRELVTSLVENRKSIFREVA